MIFKRLELKNFKSHENTAIDFQTGVSIIIGENGAGKSSIFEAISYVLFKSYDVNLSDLIRKTKNTEEQVLMEVRLTFEANGSRYMVERTAKQPKVKKTDKTKKQPSSTAKLAKLYPTKEIIATRINEVDNEIKSILNMDANTFLNAIHIKQGEISELVDKKPAERKELISKLLKLTDLEEAYKAMYNITSHFDTRWKMLKPTIKNDLESQLLETHNEYERLNNLNIISKKKYEDFNRDKEIKEKEKQKLDELKSKLDTLKLKCAHACEELKKLNERKIKLTGQLNEILEDEKQIEVLLPFVEKLKVFNEFKEEHNRFESLKKDKTAKEEIIEKNDENKKIVSAEQENFNRFNELSDEIGKLKILEAELNSKINELDGYKSTKQSLESEIKGYEEKILSFSNDANAVLVEFGCEGIREIKSGDDLTELESILLKQIESVEAQLNQLKSDIETNTTESIRLSQTNESLNDPLSKMMEVEDECPTCKSKISEEKKDELINDYQSNISSNNLRIEELQKANEELDNKKSQKEMEFSKLESVKHDIGPIRIIVDNLSKSNERLLEVIGNIDEIGEKITKSNELTPLLESKANELEELKPHHESYVKANAVLITEDEENKIKGELTDLSQNIVEIEAKLNDLVSRYDDLSIDISTDVLNGHINDLTKKDAQYHRLIGKIENKQTIENDLAANGNEITEKTQLIEKISKCIESCDYDKKTHEEITKYVEELSDEINKLATNIVLNDNNLSQFKKEIEKLHGEIEDNNKLKEEVNALAKYFKLLDKFRKLYGKDGVQKDLRKQSQPIIQKYTRQFFYKFNFNYSNLTLDEDYNISIYSPDGQVNLDMVSGGEKIALALSLRLAITQAMSKGNIETILLDEPTIHLDSQRRQELINVLHDISVIPQMIIVTHDEELENAADKIIKVEKRNGISKVIVENSN